MKLKQAGIVSLALALGLTGCAQNQTRGTTGADDKTGSTVAGGAIGCAAGAFLAHLAGKNTASGCVIGLAAGAFIGFEKARQAELAAANQAREETLRAVAAMPKPKSGPVASVGEVKTVEVTAVDNKTKETKKFQAFDAVTVELPLSQKGTPSFESAMTKLKALAERVADERGSSEIQVAYTETDAQLEKVNLSSGEVKSPKGNPITVSKRLDATVPKGLQRVTVRAGTIRMPA